MGIYGWHSAVESNKVSFLYGGNECVWNVRAKG